MLHVATNIISKDEELAKKAEEGTAGACVKYVKLGRQGRKLGLRKRKFKKRFHESDNHPPRGPIPIDETESPLCVLLWQSTIIQALYDLTASTSSAEGKLVRAEASSWFFVSSLSEDFMLVCELACLCPLKVRSMARQVAKEGDKLLDGFNFRTIRRDLSDRTPTKRVKKNNQRSAVMKFTTRRGRPPANNTGFTIIEGGKKPAPIDPPVKPKSRINREPIDICHEKGIINDDQHWAAIHFRWLYTLRFGAPGISAIDFDRLAAGPKQINDPDWQEEREREYAMAIEKLRKCGALKTVLNLAVFNHFPRYMPMGRINHKTYDRHNQNEVLKLREGLDILAEHWERSTDNT